MFKFAANRTALKIGWLACLAGLNCAPFANAAWLGYVNQTQAPILVQTSVVNANKAHACRQHKLFFGERAWDSIAVAGPVQITITDPAQKNAVLLQQQINVATQDVLLSIQWQPQPQIPGKPPVPPALRLNPIAIIGAPGVNGPQPQPQPKSAPNPGANAPIPPRAPLPPTATPPGDAHQPPAEKPKLPPSSDKPKEKPKEKSNSSSEKSKAPPTKDEPKSKSGNDK